MRISVFTKRILFAGAIAAAIVPTTSFASLVMVGRIAAGNPSVTFVSPIHGQTFTAGQTMRVAGNNVFRANGDPLQQDTNGAYMLNSENWDEFKVLATDGCAVSIVLRTAGASYTLFVPRLYTYTWRPKGGYVRSPVLSQPNTTLSKTAISMTCTWDFGSLVIPTTVPAGPAILVTYVDWHAKGGIPTFDFFSGVTQEGWMNMGEAGEHVNIIAPPPTADIRANGSNGPITIAYNTAATISWGSTNASSCTVSPGGWTGISGSQSSGNRTSLATYTLSCFSSSGSASDSVIVNVSAPPAPPPGPAPLAATLSANPNSGVAPLNNIDLTATASGGPSGTLNYTFYCNRNDTGTNITPGWAATFNSISDLSKTAQDACNYAANGTYTAKVIVERGVSAAEARVTITVGPGLAVSCSVAPTSINTGESATWSATITGGSGTPTYSWSGTDGLIGITASVTKTYSIVGTKTGTVTVTRGNQSKTQACSNSLSVSLPVAPDVTITANPLSITQGDSSVLVWTSINATACSLNHGIGSVVTSGSRNVAPVVTTTYTVICTGPGGSASSSVTVSVSTPPGFEEIPPE